MTRRICLWSGPRNVSTALMYSFAQRPDTRVVDEPLYAHYLRVSGADHPGRAQVLANQCSDGATVVRDVILGAGGAPGAASDRPVLFFKQMAHHLVELDWGFLDRTDNVLLVRDPESMLASLLEVLPEPTLRDTGLAMQARLLAHLRGRGQDPPVLDARRLLLDPRGVLERLCDRLGLAFTDAMLSWRAGPRPEDGVWAPHWYAGVHRSTGFRPWAPPRGVLPASLDPLLAECREHYAVLAAAAL